MPAKPKKEPPPPKTTRDKLDETLDKTLLKAISKGVVVLDKDGQPQTVDAPHQVLEIARKRLADLGLTKTVGKDSDAGKMAAELHLENPHLYDMNLPEIPDSSDAATG